MKYRSYPIGPPQAWTASGNISFQLGPTAGTITRMAIYCQTDITTTSATWYSDAWDRLISTLSLTSAGKTLFSFTDMRTPYHMTRLFGSTLKRPTTIADSQTNALQQFGYLFHFGVAPEVVDKNGMIQDNPFDLTAGIPAVGNGNLSLSGTWGAAAAMGSANVTINAGDLQVYVWTVQMDTGDTPEMYQPRTFPNWQMQSPSLSATSGVFVSNAQVPSGDFLHSVYSMTTNGSNNPRNDDVLSGFQLYDQRNGRDIITFGGLRDDIRQYKPYEILSQEDRNAWPPSEVEGALSVPTITAVADSGLGWLDIHNYVDKRKALAQYGADLRQLATGDLLIKYGIVDATGSALNLLFRKYQLNPDHPANAGL